MREEYFPSRSGDDITRIRLYHDLCSARAQMGFISTTVLHQEAPELGGTYHNILLLRACVCNAAGMDDEKREKMKQYYGVVYG